MCRCCDWRGTGMATLQNMALRGCSNEGTGSAGAGGWLWMHRHTHTITRRHTHTQLPNSCPSHTVVETPTFLVTALSKKRSGSDCNLRSPPCRGVRTYTQTPLLLLIISACSTVFSIINVLHYSLTAIWRSETALESCCSQIVAVPAEVLNNIKVDWLRWGEGGRREAGS